MCELTAPVKAPRSLSEEFAFEKASRHRRAVHLDEIPAAARAELVNRSRDDFLAVPVSPEIKTVAFVGATASTWERMERRPPRAPTIVSKKEDCARSDLRTIGS